MAVNPQVQAFVDKTNLQLGKLNTDLDAFVTEVKDLNDKIQALQNTPGVLGPDDQAALDAISTQAQAVVDKADALVVPTVTPPPTP